MCSYFCSPTCTMGKIMEMNKLHKTQDYILCGPRKLGAHSTMNYYINRKNKVAIFTRIAMLLCDV